MKKAYISNRFPFLTIGMAVQFRDGVFETDNAEAQALVEQNDWYGIHIHDRDAAPPAEAAPAAESYAPPAEPPAETPSEESESSPRVRHGSRGSRG